MNSDYFPHWLDCWVPVLWYKRARVRTHLRPFSTFPLSRTVWNSLPNFFLCVCVCANVLANFKLSDQLYVWSDICQVSFSSGSLYSLQLTSLISDANISYTGCAVLNHLQTFIFMLSWHIDFRSVSWPFTFVHPILFSVKKKGCGCLWGYMLLMMIRKPQEFLSHDLIELMASRANINTFRSDYKFLAEPDEDLKCLICLGVAKEPLQHEACGKLFCKECLERHGKHKPCPNCREKNSHYYVDNKSKIPFVDITCEDPNSCCIHLLVTHPLSCPSRWRKPHPIIGLWHNVKGVYLQSNLWRS